MDGVDIRIIRAMGLQPYGRDPRPAEGLRPRAIAQKLRVSPESVRDRIARMESSGVIEGYDIFPNMRLLGLEASCYILRLPDHAALDAVQERIRPLEGLVALYTFTEPTMCIEIASRSPAELERRLKMLLSLAGEGDLMKYYDVEMPTLARPLSNLDWRIIAALRGDATKPLSQVAHDLKVNPRTVKRRFDRMSSEGAFFIIPIIEPAKVPGLILFELMLWLDAEAGPSTLNALTRALDENMVCVDYPSNPEVGQYGIGLYAQRLGDIDECRRKAAAVRGVERVRPLILQGSEERFDWLDDLIGERVKATAREARSPAPA